MMSYESKTVEVAPEENTPEDNTPKDNTPKDNTLEENTPEDNALDNKTPEEKAGTRPMSDKGLRGRILLERLVPIQSPLIAFFTSIAVLFGAYIYTGIYPFGEKTLMLIDMFHQYVPFMSETISKMHGAMNLFYSWSGGLGTNFYATISYYLASPLNLLLFFFNESGVTEAVLLFTLLKVGFAAAFFFLWVRTYTGKDDFPGIAFSVMYALSGFVLSYAWNIMWLDGVYMMPLVMMGLERLVRGRSAVLFSLSVCFLMSFNFYISFFVILFTLLYYPLMLERNGLFSSFRATMRVTQRVVVFALIGLALSAVIVLPTIIAIRLTSASNDVFPNDISIYDVFFDYLSRFFVAAEPTALSGRPNLYAGLAILFLVPAYFLGKGRNKRLMIGSALLLLFLFASFNINVLDFIWHGFHFPNQLPYRNAFVFVFFAITLSFDAFYHAGRPEENRFGILLAVLLGMVILVQKMVTPQLGWQSVYLTIGFLIAYGIVLMVRHPVSTNNTKFFGAEFILFLIVIAEITANSFLVVKRIDESMHYAPRGGYAQGGDVQDLRKAVEYIQGLETGFYRMEVHPSKTVNDPYLYHYNGLSIFSSMSSVKVAKMMFRFGYHGNDVNSYKYSNPTLLMDSLLGIKYLVKRSGDDNMQEHALLEKFGAVRVYENPDALSIGFWAPEKIKSFTSLNKGAIEAQDLLSQALGGTEPLFIPAKIQNMGAERSTITSDGTGLFQVGYPDKTQQAIVKLYMKADQTMSLALDYKVQPNQIGIGNLLINEKKISFDATRSNTINVGVVDKGTEVVIELWPNSKASGPHDFHMKAYTFNVSAYEKWIERLRTRQMQVTEFRDGYVSGDITAPETGTIMTSIPYDAGWTVRVDGERVETRHIDGGFLSFDIDKGSHGIEMKFVPSGFLLGLEISLMAALVLIMARIRKWKYLMGGEGVVHGNHAMLPQHNQAHS